MRKNHWLLILLSIVMLPLIGCAGMQVKKTAVIELEGNPTTGYAWVYSIAPEGIVREVSNEYIPDKTDEQLVGSGGKFVFTFEAIAEGEAELVFSYLRTWENNPAARTAIYKAVVDEKNNLAMAGK